MRVLITGGAGFVGSRLAFRFKEQQSDSEVVVFDNLKRRGSELNLKTFKKLGITFVHGDIRSATDFSSLDDFKPDLFVEASAEPSVHAGLSQDPHYLLDTNLLGTINCLEYARKSCGLFVFLSTSRVYPIPELIRIPLRELGERLMPESGWTTEGLTEHGISETFPLKDYRSLYGSTKLCSEFLVKEYAHGFGLRSVINRCGVIAGSGQFGKVDQGVFTLWVAMHHFKKQLIYTGFGGRGLQVRDLLHPDDLFALICQQRDFNDDLRADVFNVGGGLDGSVSLKELTGLCQELTGHSIQIGSRPETAAVDMPWYITDASLAKKTFNWQPEYQTKDIIGDIAAWIKKDEKELKEIFC